MLLQLVAGMLGKHYDWHGRSDLQQTSRGFYAIHSRHLKIHDHKIGSQLFEKFHGIRAVGCLAAYFPFGVCLQENTQTLPDKFAVVHDQKTGVRLRDPLILAHLFNGLAFRWLNKSKYESNSIADCRGAVHRNHCQHRGSAPIRMDIKRASQFPDALAHSAEPYSVTHSLGHGNAAFGRDSLSLIAYLK